MSKNLLEQLKEMTVVVADTGDIHAIETIAPRDATTNPSLITAAAQMPQYQGIVDETLKQSRLDCGASAPAAKVVSLAFDRLAVSFGLEILKIVPGRVSTEVDARLSFDTAATIAKGRELIAQYEAKGVSRNRILIKIASTWEGIQAAAVLEREGIHCNLTLLFGLHQAIACAEAGVTLISPFVGRILDWYKKDAGRDSFPANGDPGVVSVTKIFAYYKRFGYQTEVMGASFRNMGEITELAGCDLLTIAPSLLAELQASEGYLPRKLDAVKAATANVEKIPMDRAVFERMHEDDRMASEKLAEGIAGFTSALTGLEEILEKRLAILEFKCSMNIVKKADCLHAPMEWGSLTWYAHTKLANSAAMTIGKCVIKPGYANSRHHHPNCEEVLHVLQGRISHSYDDTSVVLNEGDTITIPSGVVHHAINLGDVDAVLLISFSSPDRQTISA